jgi:hypothetical protein
VRTLLLEKARPLVSGEVFRLGFNFFLGFFNADLDPTGA